ncbi:AAA family ATPase [Sphingomonas mesophila]|uniref:AAA family ATPase n=1 Tax=Sphingomonas mesophila TaxID=2303576 RepID=UPI0013C2D104|nr:AAA family ATPase [Sphingomonas mesophila]
MSDFIEPARKRGDATATITARDVHDRLGLTAAHANVCQALAGRKFLNLAGLSAPKMQGPMASSTTTFTYDLKGGASTDIDQGPYWLVGSSFGRKDDQTARFLSEGIWEVDGPSEADRMHVRSMKPGHRIAIKSTFVQRHGLPFDNRGVGVSAMRIKARGVITANPGTDARVEVDWEPDPQARDWYFYTNRQTIWRVQPDTEFSIGLIQFVFADAPQDLELFLADDYWSKMYGRDDGESGPRYWIEKTLVSGRPDRLTGEHALGKALWSPQRSKDDRDIYSAMTKVREGDILFHLTDNKAITDVSVVAGTLDDSFTGVEGTEWANQPGYRIALDQHVRLEPPLPREEFLSAEPFSSQLKELVEGGAKGVFFNKRLELNQGAYLTEATPTLLAILNGAYQRYSGKSLPYAPGLDLTPSTTLPETYSLDDALETLFLERDVAEDILLLWRAKKNIILQGPPGVGKSYAAQRLAYALMGLRDRDRLRFVQFHQSYSYEDFVEGFRPTETGFALKSGKFVEFCREAEGDPDRTYVFIIDEINRGNLSKIMGELMVLIEPDKREAEWAMPLASGRAPFFVPKNVYLLGLMNTADRSLAVVDYALRRRFAFVGLQSNLSSPKFREQLTGAGVSDALVTTLVERVGLLNAEIVGDVANLGPGFAIGHSFFCSGPLDEEDETDWYARVIRTEIAPLLREYWFDAPIKAEQWTEQLLAAH